MDTETVAELNRRFGSGDKELPPLVIAELQSIMKVHDLELDDMYYKWESYCIKMNLDELKLSVEALKQFKQDLMDALERSARTQVHIKTEKRPGATPRTVTKSSDVFGMLDGLTTPGTTKMARPGSLKKRPLETPSVSRVKGNVLSSSPDHKTPVKVENIILPPSSFADRSNAGEIIEIMNDHLSAGEPPIAPFAEPRITLKAQSDQKKLGYKTLAMKLSEASEILDDRIEDFITLVAKHHELDDSVFGSATEQNTEEIVAVGRIATDSLEGGKPNVASVVLETSRRTGAGRRVHLDLTKLKGYQFFPGQIVAFRGINTAGTTFKVSEELKLPLLPNPASTPAALAAHRAKMRGGPDAMDMDDTDPPPLNVIIASGPYTADDNLDYEPLHELCNRAADTLADALILTGPFVDMEHPLIATGDFDLPDEVLATTDADQLTMATVFKWLVTPALNRVVAANPHVDIVLVPSVRDAIAKHAAWPQDAFPRRELGLHRNVKIVGNPMTFALNEAVVAVSSQDVLGELRAVELCGGRAVPDPVLLSRLPRYLIEQRHFFPVFPPVDRSKLPKTGRPDDGMPPGASLDVSYLKLGEMVNSRPDILIVPSALPPFAKVIETVFVINPGTLSKMRGAGTYARVILHAIKLKDDEPNTMLAHDIWKRARVEITRI